jgi:hypothetical protein
MVLPTHKDFYSTDLELSELRRQSHERWLALTRYLEELALIIDEEEHNQFVLRDLNNTSFLDHDHDHERSVPTADQGMMMTMMTHPPAIIMASPKKPRKQQQQVQPQQQWSTPISSEAAKNSAVQHDPTIPSTRTIPIIPGKQQANVDQHHQHHEHNNNNDDLDDSAWQGLDFSSTVAPHDIPIGPTTSQQPKPDDQHHHHEYHNNHFVVDESGWQQIPPDSTNTVASLETQWVSMAGFSDPFPPTPLGFAAVSHQKQGISLDENERIVQITGSHRARLDHQHVDFASLSLADEDGSAGDSFAAATKYSPSTKEALSSPPSWKIAPFSSSKMSHEPMMFSPASFKDPWVCSPQSNSGDLKERRVKWMNPEREVVGTTSPNTAVTEEMVSWWEHSSVTERSKSTSSISHVLNTTMPDAAASADVPAVEEKQPHHVKLCTKRQSSRYLVLEEHEANRRQTSTTNNRRKQVAPIAPQERYQPLASKEMSYSAEDADLANASAILESNKAKGRDLQQYRQKGMHHFRECVRCLLE